MNKKTIILLVILVILLGAGITVALLIPKMNTISIPKDDTSLGILTAEPATEEASADPFKNRDQTLNILMIGIDQASGYADGQRSDIMILVTLRKGLNEIRMTSFMRDTISFAPSEDSYGKLNMNFKYGGAFETLKAMNMNYDLNIRDFVQFDYNDLEKLVNAVGGVDVYVDDGELADFNYMATNGDYYHVKPLPSTGNYTLDGRQVQLYVRSRLRSGGDTARTARQREVLQQILKKLKTMPKAELYSVAKTILPEIETSYSYSGAFELIDYYLSVRNDARFTEGQFPGTHSGYQWKEIWYEVSPDLEADIIKLHEEVFGEKDYKVSPRAKEYIEFIKQIPFY